MGSISAVVPAYNEAPRVGRVLDVLVSSSHISEVIVVDDGSADNTSAIAVAKGARVVRNDRRLGKGEALQRGVEAAQGSILFFCDADIVGLTPDVIREMVMPVASGGKDMFIAARKEKERRFGRFSYSPLLDGQRALTRNAWEHVPERFKRGYAIESALNYFVPNFGYKLYSITQVKKEEKHGYFIGKVSRYAMYRDIVLTKLRLTV